MAFKRSSVGVKVIFFLLLEHLENFLTNWERERSRQTIFYFILAVCQARVVKRSGKKITQVFFTDKAEIFLHYSDSVATLNVFMSYKDLLLTQPARLLSLSLSLSSECGVQIANSCLASYQDHFGTLQEFIIHFNCCADWKVCALESDIFVNNSVQIKPRLRPYYFLLRSKDCMLETYMILAKVGV